jgi:hypothetical protein
MVEQPALAIATAKPGSALPLTIIAIREKFSMLRDGVGFRNRAITTTPLGYPDGIGGVFVAVQVYESCPAASLTRRDRLQAGRYL